MASVVPRMALALVLALMTSVGVALAHDPSSWGGLYRSRDGGATWFLANEGRFLTAALDLAVDPADSTHLLLGTESGLLRSRNGGRDWELDAPERLVGAVFAATFDRVGRRALVSSSSALLALDDTGGSAWREVTLPSGAAPARTLAAGAESDRVYLAGWQGFYRTDDWGATWTSIGDELPATVASRLLVLPGPPEFVLTVVGGSLWASTDGGQRWQPRDAGLPSGAVDALAGDPSRPARLWAAGTDRLFRSDDIGQTWTPVGGPLGDANTAIRGIGVHVDGAAIVLTTNRGLYRSLDVGGTWELLADNLPVHLEAHPLVRDPRDPTTLYAGFSLTPYEELWQRAADGTTALERLDTVTLLGAAAFLGLVLLAGGGALRWLGRYYHATPPDRPRTPSAREGRAAAPVTLPLERAPG